ncbi:hypothetical protein P3X46_026266 [Hevea brasiliensis]|uniref:DUF642 domain-containing protein n=1 Tax=Hevea brasiliensis TaxID=3981 RepID=A0ABQ9KX72_HEVBR|nr:protein DUF642 L-GALACTONO-1,4-LACTONE-RESPONSIVE GENE 2 [Hevea brasiliensis]KAJ9152734.1 hypothetical protein P3X46_026266 [Hevea brasiliensis]
MNLGACSSSFSSKKMHRQIFLVSLLLIGPAFADLLQNSDFESPPSNLPKNSTTPFQQLNENSTIPGWSFEGTILYVTTTQTIALPGNGHALQLGQDGKINQTFNPIADYVDYLLTFTLAPGGQNCSTNANVGVSAPDSHSIFSFKQDYGKEGWETFGLYLGSWEQQEPINLVLESQSTESDANSTCWPLIDKLLLKTIETLVPGDNNLLLNGGFEYGPEFLSNSTEGVLLDPVPTAVLSPLRQWSITGTVKYIDSKHYFVPEGNAAVEFLSGVSASIQAATTLKDGSTYSLEFTLGDANDSCEGNFVVGAQAGSTAQNFTLQSNGTGSAKKLSLAFKADSTTTLISFVSYATTQTKDGVFCGPIVDNVVLRASQGMKSEIKWEVFIFLLFLVGIL